MEQEGYRRHQKALYVHKVSEYLQDCRCYSNRQECSVRSNLRYHVLFSGMSEKTASCESGLVWQFLLLFLFCLLLESKFLNWKRVAILV